MPDFYVGSGNCILVFLLVLQACYLQICLPRLHVCSFLLELFLLNSATLKCLIINTGVYI